MPERRNDEMKTAIHPELTRTTITCQSCGTAIETRTARPVRTVDVCASCHPAYTGELRREARGDRIDRFERRRQLATAGH
jgi:large subunit ribosomal protein L31